MVRQTVRVQCCVVVIMDEHLESVSRGDCVTVSPLGRPTVATMALHRHNKILLLDRVRRLRFNMLSLIVGRRKSDVNEQSMTYA